MEEIFTSIRSIIAHKKESSKAEAPKPAPHRPVCSLFKAQIVSPKEPPTVQRQDPAHVTLNAPQEMLGPARNAVVSVGKVTPEPRSGEHAGGKSRECCVHC